MQMLPENSDPVALTAQADIHRFYIRVVQPALEEFVPADDVDGIEAADIEAFLETARIHTHNALCYEMRRTFALTIGALFERQLRSWLLGKMPDAAKAIEEENWTDLIKRTEVVVGGFICTDMTNIEMLRFIANAVRHGNGNSASKLLGRAPLFWNHVRTKPDLKWKSDLVGNMRISDAQLSQYVIAVLRFWHQAGASPVP